MANNRMYLRNKRTGACVLIAKFYPSDGWQCKGQLQARLNRAFTGSDFTPEEQRVNAAAIDKTLNPFDGPYKAQSSEANGEEWELQYEDGSFDPQTAT